MGIPSFFDDIGPRFWRLVLARRPQAVPEPAAQLQAKVETEAD
jgi:hypothetical protein